MGVYIKTLDSSDALGLELPGGMPPTPQSLWASRSGFVGSKHASTRCRSVGMTCERDLLGRDFELLDRDLHEDLSELTMKLFFQTAVGGEFLTADRNRLRLHWSGQHGFAPQHRRGGLRPLVLSAEVVPWHAT